MRLAELESLEHELTRETALKVRESLRPFVGMRLNDSLWRQILRLLFEIVSPASRQSAQIGRRFYDDERARVFPDAPRHDVYLAELNLAQFTLDMEEVRTLFTGREVTPEAVDHAALRTARSVENSARWTVMKAVEQPDPYFDDDDEYWDPELWAEASKDLVEVQEKRRQKKRGAVRGWARVATGRETCGWCLMLVSRGAVYRSAKDAGSKLDDRDSLKVDNSANSSSGESMNAWHTGCDCKVVPVFDLEDWTGKERADAALKMWYAETKGLYGKDAVRAMKRAAESGKYRDYL